MGVHTRFELEVILWDNKIVAIRRAGNLSAVKAVAENMSVWLSGVGHTDLEM